MTGPPIFYCCKVYFPSHTSHHHKAYIPLLRYHFEMTPKEDLSKDEKGLQALEEICENTRAIRRVVNRILDHLHESDEEENNHEDYDPDTVSWEGLYDDDDMYY